MLPGTIILHPNHLMLDAALIYFMECYERGSQRVGHSCAYWDIIVDLEYKVIFVKVVTGIIMKYKLISPKVTTLYII
jgi:hypothetical protein